MLWSERIDVAVYTSTNSGNGGFAGTEFTAPFNFGATPPECHSQR